MQTTKSEPMPHGTRTHSPIRLSIRLNDTKSVSGLLLIPEQPNACLVLAHGAGAGMSRRFMVSVATGLFSAVSPHCGTNSPIWRRGSRRPDRTGLAQATVRAAVNEANDRLPNVALFAGGKSFGGRMTSQAQAETPLSNVQGIAFWLPAASREQAFDRSSRTSVQRPDPTALSAGNTGRARGQRADGAARR